MLSEMIYKLRRKNGLSQEQLAEKLGVSRQAISKWEGGQSTPELDKLIALSEYFHVTVDELTKEREDESREKSQTEEAKESIEPMRNTRKLGIMLWLIGSISMAILGILMVAHPSAADQINESSTITVNGSGMFMLVCAVAMVLGILLIFRKK